MSVVATYVEHAASQAGTDMASVLAFVSESLGDLARTAHRGPSLTVISVPAPLAALEALAYMDERVVLWDPPEGPKFSGIGNAAEITATGQDRMQSLLAQAGALWPRIRCMDYPGLEPAAPRLFGGFAFAPGAAADQPWADFGDARFVLPAVLYMRHGDHAKLSLVVDTAKLMAGKGREPESGQARYLAELERVLGILHRSAAAETATPEPARSLVMATHEMDPGTWRKHIEDIRAAILERTCDKIVAARCSVVELEAPVEPASVLGALHHRYPDCYRFGYRFGPRAMFVGATPERLIARVGSGIFTEALAGSIAAGPGSERTAANALLASRKDRSEQDFVVRTIVAELGPLCSELDVPAEPEIRALRHVLHLETPIRGTLRAPTHILDLVAALHPTPAVGGVPTATAMAWIAEREPVPRGWYAAPVGWFNQSGQGEFAVAIRSGLLAGKHAYIYAGAGIVRDSDPDAEFAETKLKQRAVLDALGVRS